MSQAGSPVYIIDGARTPFLKSRQVPGPFSASDLAVAAGREVLARQPIAPTELNEVVLGCMMPSPDEANIGRLVALRLQCGENVPGWTVQRNCASGLQAIDSAYQSIALGRHQLSVAGGTEVMSRAPLLLRPSMARWLSEWRRARSVIERMRLLKKLRPKDFSPIIALLRGLTDPIVGLSMPQTAALIAHEHQVTREQMDAFALQSHEQASEAMAVGDLTEIVPIIDAQGQLYDADDGVRADTDLAQLAALRPILDKRFGAITAGNSSQVSDGAAMLLLAGEAAIEQYDLKPCARIVDIEWSGLAPERMGLGPVYAQSALLERQGLSVSDIDYWEINEAFAGQVLACLQAFSDPEFNQTQLGRDTPWDAIAIDRLNIEGGAVAIGHPVGASGARITWHLADILRRKKAKRGMASICIGGGQGGAILIERVGD